MPTKFQAQVKMNLKAKASQARKETAVLASTMGAASTVKPGSTAAKVPAAGKQPHPARPGVPQGSVKYLLSEPTKAPRLVPSHGNRTVGIVYEPVKRAYDLVLGLVLLIIAAPIILIAAAAIRLESHGSPFFVQTRLGKNGRPFKIFKLRGMFEDARVRFPSYYDYSKKQNLDFCFHHEEDPRVTRAGKFIRKTSIDELPNLWNVVLGDMSLVGPRPEIPEVLALYGDYREEYLSVKPGVTCLSKCTGRDRLTKRETIEFDIDYIRRRGFLVDVQILWRTFRGVVLRRDVF
jgi:lipopolysaccharide/colanic/teichoic acid biosynthesis glycosyltransferase